MARLWDSALHGEPTRHGNSSRPELHRSSQRSQIPWPDHSSTIDNFDQSIAWLEPSRSVSMSLNWITHQLAPPLRHGPFMILLHVCVFFGFIMWIELCILYPWSLKILPSIFLKFYFRHLSFRNFHYALSFLFLSFWEWHRLLIFIIKLIDFIWVYASKVHSSFINQYAFWTCLFISLHSLL